MGLTLSPKTTEVSSCDEVLHVLRLGHTFEIPNGVVLAVSVYVIDNHFRRDRALEGLPHESVKTYMSPCHTESHVVSAMLIGLRLLQLFIEPLF